MGELSSHIIFFIRKLTDTLTETIQAWNISPRRRNRWCPSAEFVESALILFYGSTNIFMEHFSSWGGGWSAQDLEHVSITILFIGGGLVSLERDDLWFDILLMRR